MVYIPLIIVSDEYESQHGKHFKLPQESSASTFQFQEKGFCGYIMIARTKISENLMIKSADCI